MKAIPVRLAMFVSPIDGPGLSAAGNCSAEHNGRATKFKMEYQPDARLLKVVNTTGDGRILVGFIPVERVSCLYFYEEAAPVPVVEKKTAPERVAVKQ